MHELLFFFLFFLSMVRKGDEDQGGARVKGQEQEMGVRIVKKWKKKKKRGKIVDFDKVGMRTSHATLGRLILCFRG
jgi:hypothetical protein